MHARRALVVGGLLVASAGTAYAHGGTELLFALGWLALLGLVVLGAVFGVFYVAFLALARLGVLRSPAAWAAGALVLALAVVKTIPERVLPFPLRLRMAGMDKLFPRMQGTGFRDDEIPRLVASLREGADVDEQITAIAILAARGPRAVPALIAALESPDPWTRGGAAVALAGIGPPATVAIPRVIRRLAAERSDLALIYELFFLERAAGWGDRAAWPNDALPVVAAHLEDAGLIPGNAAITLAARGAAAAPALGDLRRAQTARRGERPDRFVDEQLASAIRSICDAVRGNGAVAAECS